MTSCMPSQNDQMATIFIKKYKPLLLSECLRNIHQYFVTRQIDEIVDALNDILDEVLGVGRNNFLEIYKNVAL